MKFSHLIAVSVNVAAAANALPSGASEQGASWLQASLNDISSKGAAKAARPQVARKIKHSSSSQLTSGVVKMRPFVPNRYLPSERELQQAMVPQQAQIDESADSGAAFSTQSSAPRALSGAVSQYGDATAAQNQQLMQYRQQGAPYERYLMESNQRQLAVLKSAVTKFMAQRAPRAAQGLVPVVPDELTKMQIADPVVPEPPQRQLSSQVPMYIPAPPKERTAQPVLPPVEAPVLSPEEQAILEQMVEQSLPQASNAAVNGNAQSYAGNPDNGTGPSSFPFNILPTQAMQSGRSGRRPLAPAARFGSWHAPGSYANTYGPSQYSGAVGLPQAGFHTYLQQRRVVAYNAFQVRPTYQHVPTRVGHVAKHARIVRSTAVQYKARPVAQAPVSNKVIPALSYAPYASRSY